MSEPLSKVRYNLQARLYPALLVIFPFYLLLYVWFPVLRSLGPGISALSLFCGVSFFLMNLVRDKGLALQSCLYSSWGGKPSTILLRHKNTEISQQLKDRYRETLEKLVPGLKMPSADDEEKEHDQADAIYDSAGQWLLANTRDKTKYPLVFEENVNYGFRRNFLAMRPFTLLTGIGSLFGCGTIIAFSFMKFGKYPTVEQVIASCIIIIYVVLVYFCVHKEWVKTPAFAFAQQLLGTCDLLMSERIERKKS